MAQHIGEIMTPDPVTATPRASIAEISRMMREGDIGEVLIVENGKVRGMVTDRDLVVRAVADALDPETTVAQDVCSADLATCPPDAEIDEAVQLMRDNAIRRLPVIEGDRLVGTVSIGDLAIERDRSSALADISAASPNR
ncbi:CBS domain-containing protein [Streptomyces marispadix]|uniref:CBS domain-containing protein n=1 Tax=Streptomyces marispadix TaxID=2922868 RepID=A0ABS9ST29_9ACTN|nr:CBS domain-containing protein [Streptomyces marispadix]MCH6159343.1 CBS domain-containing protein [Streptomyces marispadix]